MLSFLDTFSGYHQISMYSPDAEKTAFITERDILGAMYQRMVNRVFKVLLGDMMEAYVDDMIVKSKQG